MEVKQSSESHIPLWLLQAFLFHCAYTAEGDVYFLCLKKKDQKCGDIRFLFTASKHHEAQHKCCREKDTSYYLKHVIS